METILILAVSAIALLVFQVIKLSREVDKYQKVQDKIVAWSESQVKVNVQQTEVKQGFAVMLIELARHTDALNKKVGLP